MPAPRLVTVGGAWYGPALDTVRFYPHVGDLDRTSCVLCVNPILVY